MNQNKFLLLGVVISNFILISCASLSPSVKAVCTVCNFTCPLIDKGTVSGTIDGFKLECPIERLFITNWKEVEKGVEPEFGCKF